MTLGQMSPAERLAVIREILAARRGRAEQFDE